MKRIVGLAIMVLGLLALVPSVASATTPACPSAGTLTLVKTSDKASYTIGDIVTFTLKVTANNCDAKHVVVVDALPLGLTVSDPSVLGKTFATLPAGTSGSYSFQAVANANGTLTNTAHAAGDAIGDDALTGEDWERGCRGREPSEESVEDSEVADITCPVSADASKAITVSTPQPSPGPQGPPGPPGSPVPVPVPSVIPAPPGSVPGLPNTGLA